MRFNAVIVLVVLAAACGATKKPPSLIDEIRSYNDGIRWSQPELSAVRIPLVQRASFVNERDELVADLRVGDYEVKSIRYRDAREKAYVDVRYTWHLDSRGVVFETVSRQSWERRGKLWLRVSEERLRGEPMPGLAEPSEPPTAESEGSANVGEGSTPADQASQDEVLYDSGPVAGGG